MSEKESMRGTLIPAVTRVGRLKPDIGIGTGLVALEYATLLVLQ